MSHTKRRHEPGSESSDLFTLASQILTKSLLTPSYTSFSAQNDTCKRHPATFYPLPHYILCAMHFSAFHDSTACVTTFLSARWGLLVSIILAFYFFLHPVDLKTMTLCHSPTYMYLYTCTILGWLNILPFSFNPSFFSCSLAPLMKAAGTFVNCIWLWIHSAGHYDSVVHTNARSKNAAKCKA